MGTTGTVFFPFCFCSFLRFFAAVRVSDGDRMCFFLSGMEPPGTVMSLTLGSVAGRVVHAERRCGAAAKLLLTAGSLTLPGLVARPFSPAMDVVGPDRIEGPMEDA